MKVKQFALETFKGITRNRYVAPLAVGGATLALAASARADDDIVTAVTTKLTALGANATTLGLSFLGIVAIIAVIAMGAHFLRKGH